MLRYRGPGREKWATTLYIAAMMSDGPERYKVQVPIITSDGWSKGLQSQGKQG